MDTDASLFTLACQNGDLSIVSQLIGSVDVHQNNDYAIRCACTIGHYQIVELLIQHGADVNAAAGTPIALAVRNNDINIVKLLVNNNADINIDDDYALCKSIDYNHREIT